MSGLSRLEQWSKLTETGFAPFEYKKQHDVRIAKLNKLVACIRHCTKVYIKLSASERSDEMENILKSQRSIKFMTRIILAKLEI